MARKSRRNVCQTAETAEETSVRYETGIYARLSVENSGKDDDGDSIANQISFCREYLEGQKDLKLYDIYEDNGEKGTNFDRPEFQRLMDDVRSGKVKCILVKDLSRFGRDYIEAGQYLEKIFPFLGVRFISITDGYDSLTADDAEGALMVPLKNMINDVYAKDISRKIITSFRARQEKGEILPAFAPYGYVKSKTVQYRYEVDMETAPYVKQIFEWRAEGINRTEICRRLDKMGAVTPAMRKVQLGIWKAEKYKHTVWDRATVAGIMKNPTYTGCIVYGRTPRSLCDGIKAHHADPKEWRYVPNAHEPIISQELFDRVQAILTEEAKRWAAAKEESYEVRKNIVNVFQGRIWCGDCGKRMRFIKPTDKRYPRDEDHARFACGGYMDSDKRSCSRHWVRYPDVKKAVAEVIRTQMEYALSQEKLMRNMRGSTKEKNLLDSYTAKVNFLQQEQARIDIKRAGLFENFAEGILDEEEYRFAKKRYDEEAVTVGEKLTVARKAKAELDAVLSPDNKWIAAMHRAENEDVLSESLVKDLIRKVSVYEGNRIEVELNYGEDRALTERILAEMEKGEAANE